ncbi:MAG: hypothetical protein A2029_05235 [Chloroflexi bacterium RBG_19FT_COMBO_47_9]|nr:MAG: hypothetical protein A2029_05235 [Chloroflexi bacterium RBG_19FT_COMBO_47_9]
MLKLYTLSLILTLVGSYPSRKAACSSIVEAIELARHATGNPEAFTELYHRCLTGTVRRMAEGDVPS